MGAWGLQCGKSSLLTGLGREEDGGGGGGGGVGVGGGGNGSGRMQCQGKRFSTSGTYEVHH